MDIEYIYRPSSKEVSIEKCFDSIINCISRYDGFHVSRSFSIRYSNLLMTILFNIIRYAIRSRKSRVFHITGDVQFVACLMNPRNTVMTVHDLVLLHETNINKYFQKLVYWFWYYIPLKRLKYICCISEATKRDMISFFPWTASKITVIPSPVGDIYSYSKKEFNAQYPRILHVGTRENKNLLRVIKALKDVPCHLSIIGKLSDEQIALLKETGIDYSNAFGISDEEMIREYHDADIISFPSLFEGFGVPIIEGQVVGRPIVTSVKEPMKSVAGPNAILVDPESVESIREGFLTIINDKERRELCIKSGLENSKRFKTVEVVKQYMEIYKKIESTL